MNASEIRNRKHLGILYKIKNFFHIRLCKNTLSAIINADLNVCVYFYVRGYLL